MKRILIFFLIFALAFSIAGCSKDTRNKSEEKKFAVEKEFHKGGAPITVRVKISSESITIADLLEFVIEIERVKGVNAEIPSMSDIQPKFGNFLIRDFQRMPEEILKNGITKTGMTYILEPQLSGKYIIEPFEIKFTVEGEKSETPHSIETERFEIDIKSLSEKPEADIKPIQGPVAIPAQGINRKILLIFITVTIAAIVAICAVIIISKRRKSVIAKKKLPAHVIALEALRSLREKKLIEQGLIKEFYYEISNIMRHYIENRFGLSAPEQTTEEFLQSMSKDRHFDAKTQELLASFLEHCDMVKFARYAPETAEIQQAFNVTRDFIEGTKQENGNGV